MIHMNVDNKPCADSSDCCPVDIQSEAAVQESDQRLAALGQALAHPLRVHILRRLSVHNQCICADVVNDLGLPQSTVSQHLKVLLDAGLVAVSVQGRTRRYCLHPSGLRELRTLIVNL